MGGLTANSLLRAFLYSRGSMTDLGALIGPGSFSEGHAINDSGQVTGGALTAGMVTDHAFLYSGGIVSDLGTLGGLNSEGWGINNSGQVTGVSWVAGNTTLHAFIYAGGKMTDLGTLPNGSNSIGYAINNSGQVTGESDTASPPQQPPPVPPADTLAHAYIYSAGKMTDLGTLGGVHSSGLSINANGQVVGWSNPSNTAASFSVAFIYTDGTMYDLNTLVASGLAGATLNEARGINDVGQIVANGCNGATCQAYRLDPMSSGGGGGGGGCGITTRYGQPDPTLPLLLLSALIAVLARSRSRATRQGAPVAPWCPRVLSH